MNKLSLKLRLFFVVASFLSVVVFISVFFLLKREMGWPHWSAMALLLLCGLAFSFGIFRTISLLKKSVDQISQDSKKSYTIGRNLNSAAQKVASSSNQQAAAIEETSASLEVLNGIVATNMSSSNEAKDLANSANQAASQGKQNMEKLIISMQEISSSSKKIEEIMQIIDDIAFQINLLALNASVEAARAGEHGKGFAVVAEAVRNLAHKSAEASKQIGQLIQESLDKIKHGHEVASEGAQSVGRIADFVQKVSSRNLEIAEASKEQSSGLAQISRAISELEKTTIDNSSVSESASQYAKDSLSQAESLMRLLEVLKEAVQGASGASSSVANAEGADLDFDGAIEAHLKWKARLANYISGQSNEKLSSKTVCQDNQCALGKWIHGSGKKFGKKNAYSKLKLNHAQFHLAAGEVVKAVEEGKISIAQSLISNDSSFQRLTDSTVQSIYDLREEIEGVS